MTRHTLTKMGIKTYISILVVAVAYHYSTLTLYFNYDNVDKPAKHQYQCQLPEYGFELPKATNPQYLHPSEDIEVNYDLNILVAAIGIRDPGWNWIHKPLDQAHGKIEFQGVYIYELDKLDQEPVKIPIPRAQPHGIDIFVLNDHQVRIFMISHKLFDFEKITGEEPTGDEEIIYFDYDLTTKGLVNGQFYRIKSDLHWAGNDVVALNKNEIVASQWLSWDYGHENNDKYDLDLGLAYTAISYFEFDDADASQEYKPVTQEKIIINNLRNSNGIKYDADRQLLFINQCTRANTLAYKWNGNPESRPILHKTIQFGRGFVTDNISFTQDKKHMLVTGFNNFKETLKTSYDLPSYSMKVDINGDNFDWEVLYEDKEGLTSSSIAWEIGGEERLVVGSPFKNMYICDRK